MVNKGIIKAKEIIEHFAITEPNEYSLEEIIAGVKGPVVKYEKMKSAEGRIVNGNDLSIITINEVTNEGKRRFSLAHEFGHYIMHKDIKFINDTEDSFWDWSGNKEIETEANYFAAELLMPEEIFFRLSRKKAFNVDSINELSEAFKTSFLSTAIRYAEKGNDPIILICSSNKKIRWFFKNSEFKHFIEIRREDEIPSGTATGDYYRSGKLDDYPVEIEPSHWKIKAYKNLDLSFAETVVPFPQYGYALTFISII